MMTTRTVIKALDVLVSYLVMCGILWLLAVMCKKLLPTPLDGLTFVSIGVWLIGCWLEAILGQQEK